MTETHKTLDQLAILQLLPPDLKRFIMDSFVPVSFSFGSPIVREGEDADALYVMVSGKARVVKKSERGDELALGTLRVGDSFGEMGLLDHARRSATVRASSEVEALRLDRAIFEEAVRSRPEIREYFEVQIKHRRLQNFFRQFTAFAHLPVAAMLSMLNDLEAVSVGAHEPVIRQGDPPGPMFVVEEGRLRVFVEENGRRRYLAYLRRGDFFGELSLFKGAPRAANVESVSDCRLLRLNEVTFRALLRDFPDFRRSIEDRIAQYAYVHEARVPLDFRDEILPADSAHEEVSRDQVDQVVEAAASADEKPAPFASEDGRFIKKSARIRRFPHVRQLDEMDCGAACLAMVCRYFGRAVSLARIRQLVHTSLDGTNLKGLCSAATELGLAARSVKASARNLAEMPLPAIVHWEGNHWVVVYHVGGEHVRLADPALGLRRLSRVEFERSWSGYAALFDYTEAFESAPEGTAGVRWVLPLFRPFLGIILKGVALAVVVSALQMVLPVFTQVIVDRVLIEKDVGLLHMLIGGMVGVLTFMVLAMLIQRYLLSFVAVRLDSISLDFLTRRLLALPLSYFNTRRTGDIQRRLQGIRQVREFVVQSGVAGLTAVVQLASALVLMVLYSPVLTLVFLGTVPVYVLMMVFSAIRLRPIYQDLEAAFGRYSSYQIDAIKGIETVKAMGAEGTFRELMLGQFHGLARRMFRADFTMMTYEGAMQMVSFLSIIFFLLVGAHQVMAGTMTIGALVAFNSLVVLANAPIVTVLSLWDNLQMASVLMARLNDVFEQEPEQGADHSGLTPVKTLEGRISFRGMGFRYGGPESPPILEEITFDIPPGKRVAIVGRSGSGKTTLVKCLSGLLEPTDGTILYDGIDLKTLNYRDLRRQIGFVLQENYLFDDTIARNIAFGEEEPDMDRVLWAARVANAHEFVERLPLGYDTKVGESGLALSGGQKQRVAIARAFYNQPAVLVLDEATSALDTESERVVKENMERMLEGRTAIVIAQRLSTVRDADLIVVLERGRLAESGDHEELMERKGLYYYLVSQQLTL